MLPVLIIAIAVFALTSAGGFGLYTYDSLKAATPGNYELEKSAGDVADQVVRPTGLLDPELEVRPVATQVDDLLSEIRLRSAKDERVLVTTLTKRMAEVLSKDDESSSWYVATASSVASIKLLFHAKLKYQEIEKPNKAIHASDTLAIRSHLFCLSWCLLVLAKFCSGKITLSKTFLIKKLLDWFM